MIEVFSVHEPSICLLERVYTKRAYNSLRLLPPHHHSSETASEIGEGRTSFKCNWAAHHVVCEARPERPLYTTLLKRKQSIKASLSIEKNFILNGYLDNFKIGPVLVNLALQSWHKFIFCFYLNQIMQLSHRKLVQLTIFTLKKGQNSSKRLSVLLFVRSTKNHKIEFSTTISDAFL